MDYFEIYYLIYKYLRIFSYIFLLLISNLIYYD